MKNIFKRAGFIVLPAVFLFVLGCKNEPDYKGAGYVDQQITLGTPSVQGKAYPGVNYIYWERVANAINGYTLSIYEDDVLMNTTPIILSENQTWYADTDVKYNVTKTYKVRALGDSAGRYVIYTESNAGSVKLTPIVPPADTTALELAKYEKGYKAGDEYTYSWDNDYYDKNEYYDEGKALYSFSKEVSVKKSGDVFFVSFPAKAYLVYSVYSEHFGTKSLVGTYQDLAVNDATATVTVSGIVQTSGYYYFYLKVSACNAKYASSDYISTAGGYNVQINRNVQTPDIAYSTSLSQISWNPVVDTLSGLAADSYEVYVLNTPQYYNTGNLINDYYNNNNISYTTYNTSGTSYYISESDIEDGWYEHVSVRAVVDSTRSGFSNEIRLMSPATKKFSEYGNRKFFEGSVSVYSLESESRDDCIIINNIGDYSGIVYKVWVDPNTTYYIQSAGNQYSSLSWSSYDYFTADISFSIYDAALNWVTGPDLSSLISFTSSSTYSYYYIVIDLSDGWWSENSAAFHVYKQ